MGDPSRLNTPSETVATSQKVCCPDSIFSDRAVNASSDYREHKRMQSDKHCVRRDVESASTRRQDCDAEVQVPLSFHVRGTPNGKPDLQLQLFSLKLGGACRPSDTPAPSRYAHGHQSGGRTCACARLLLVTCSWKCCDFAPYI